MPASPWTDIVRIAARSPSTHNTQGWRVRANEDDTVTLFFDRERTLPDEDANGDFNIVNMGVFTRGMEIAAASSGQRLRYTFALEDSDSSRRHTEVATLRLEPGSDPGDAALLDPFLRRRTARCPYDGHQIPDSALKQLQEFTRSRGHAFGYTQDPDDVLWHLELNADTITEDLQSPRIRHELHLWTRFTTRQASRKRDGLWATCMNQSPLNLWSAYRFPWILRLRWTAGFLKHRYLQTQSGTPAIGWLVGSIEGRERQFETGRFVLDWWLELTKMGIYMLPFGSVYTNQTSNERAGERIDAPDFWLIARMGYCAEPPQSFRLPPEQLWIESP